MKFLIKDKTDYENENFKNQDLLYLLQTCLSRINWNEEITNISPLFNIRDFEEIEFPEKNVIDIYFTENNELFNEGFQNENIEGESILGFCTLSNNEEYYENPTIFINLNSNNLYHFVRDNKDLLTKSEISEEIVSTLTHEVSHAIEYLECSGGLRPSDVDIFFEEGEFPLSADEALNGYGMYSNNQFENIEEISGEILEELMEERVEFKGRVMLSKFYDNIDIEHKINAINNLIPKKIKRHKL